MAEQGHDINMKDISFSGFWGQGDGASFTAENGSLSVRSLLKELGVKMKDLPRGTGKEIKEELITASIMRTSHHYCHENTVSFNISYDGENSAIEKAIFGLEDQLQELVRNKMRELYSSLEKYYNELTEDGAVKEELIELEYEYFQDGREFAV